MERSSVLWTLAITSIGLFMVVLTISWSRLRCR